MRKELEKTSKNPIEKSLKAEQKNTENIEQGKEEKIEGLSFYEKKAAAGKDERRAKFHSLLIRAMPYLFWTVTVIIVDVIGVRVWHLVVPECWVWLGEEKLSDIDKILEAALGGGFIGSRLQKFFPEKSSLK